MSLEVGMAKISDEMIELFATLQEEPGIITSYRKTVSALSRMLILSPYDDDDMERMGHLRSLQMMLRDLETIALPPGVVYPVDDFAGI